MLLCLSYIESECQLWIESPNLPAHFYQQNTLPQRNFPKLAKAWLQFSKI